MDFDAWLVESGFDPKLITDKQRPALLASWKAAAAGDKLPPTGSLEELKEQSKREATRRDFITATVRREMDAAEHPHLLAEDRDLIAAIGERAIDERWATDRFELELSRATRPRYSSSRRAAAPEIPDVVIECALARTAGLNAAATYPAATLEAAAQHYPHGMHLSDLILSYARRSGYTGTSVKADPAGAIRAARSAPLEIRAGGGGWGPSTRGASLGAMLAGVGNRFFRAGFEAIDDTWRTIAARRSASDFKAITTYSLTGDLTFKKLPPGGEIQHGQLDATTYSNQLDTYARMLGLDRRDIINDELNAFGSVAKRLGRGGAVALNRLFWGIFLNNAAFYTAGRKNLITAAPSPYLTPATLDAAYSLFLAQTDPDGQLLGSKPKFLVVPPALAATAKTLMTSPVVTGGTTPTMAKNIWEGTLEVVVPPYLQDPTLTGNSTSTWYLAADPGDLALIEVAFLNGQETPTVEEVDADPGMLGQAFRGIFDIGVALQEYRAGNKTTA